VGIPTSALFLISAIALVLGLLMLRISRHADGGAQPRDRRRWAAQKEWEYLDSDPVLPSRWRYGTIHQGGPGVARNLVTGSVPTSQGRRLIYVFDHEQAGRLSSVVCAVQRRSTTKGAFELRLPSAPLPDDAGLDLLEPVGERYAFVSDPAAIRPLITPRLVRAADAIGDDIELVWGEDAWVLCTAPLNYSPEQLEDLLDRLIDLAGALEDSGSGGGVEPGTEAMPRLPAPGSDDDFGGGSSSSAATWARSLSAQARRSATTADGPIIQDTPAGRGLGDDAEEPREDKPGFQGRSAPLKSVPTGDDELDDELRP
jgi:hypothetical protein